MCRCGVSNWREIRSALGLQMIELAELLGVSYWTIYRAEIAAHKCPGAPVVRGFKRLLSEPEYSKRLAAHHVVNPFEVSPMARGRKPSQLTCSVCGEDVRVHIRCKSCGCFSGERHFVGVILDGYCDHCKDDAERIGVPVEQLT